MHKRTRSSASTFLHAFLLQMKTIRLTLQDAVDRGLLVCNTLGPAHHPVLTPWLQVSLACSEKHPSQAKVMPPFSLIFPSSVYRVKRKPKSPTFIVSVETRWPPEIFSINEVLVTFAAPALKPPISHPWESSLGTVQGKGQNGGSWVCNDFVVQQTETPSSFYTRHIK